MNKPLRLTLYILFTILLVAGAVRVYEVYKKKIFYGFIKRNVEVYVSKKYNVVFSCGGIGGNIFRSLSLYDVSVGKIQNVPEGLQFKARKAIFKYTVSDLINRKPRVEIEGLKLTYGSLTVPVDFHEDPGRITLRIDKKYFNLNWFKSLFLPDEILFLDGLGSLEGFVVLEGLKPKFFSVKFESDNLGILYASKFRARADLNLELKNSNGTPYLQGDIDIHEGEYYGAMVHMNTDTFTSIAFLDNLAADLHIKGENIELRTDPLDVFVIGDVQVTKREHQPFGLKGDIASMKGTYIFRENIFELKKAQLIFEGYPQKEPDIDITGEAKVKRYFITASVKGTPNNSRLDISSKPELSRNEIISLLLFGKKIKELDALEEKQLWGQGDIVASFMSKFLLGNAEAKAAWAIGVDEINVQMDGIKPGSSRAGMPSVEIGKYLGNDKLYGSYKVSPSQATGENPRQAVSGEYSITDNIVVQGERDFKDSVKIPEEDKVSVKFKWKF